MVEGHFFVTCSHTYTTIYSFFDSENLNWTGLIEVLAYHPNFFQLPFGSQLKIFCSKRQLLADLISSA